MALVLADRVQQTGTANTTVSFTLSGSVTGYQSFAVVGNGNTTYYAATDGSGNWEVGIGTYSTTGPTLTRTTILSSSNSGSAVTLFGTVNVFVTYPSEKSVNLDGSGNVSALGTVSSGVWQGTAVAVGYGGTGLTSITAGYIPYGNGTSAVQSSSNLTFDGVGAITLAGLTSIGAGNSTGNKNYLDNGNFDVWQAGRIASTTTANYILPDRWQYINDGTNGSAIVFSQQTFTLGQTAVPNNPKYYLNWAYTNVTTPSNYIRQRIEGVNTLQGQQITISAWLSTLSGTALCGFGYQQEFGSGGSPSAGYYPAGNSFTVTTTWQKFTYTTTVASISGKTIGTNNNDAINICLFAPVSGASGTLSVSQFQCEIGPVATSFDLRPIEYELARCQRHYFVAGAPGNTTTWTGVVEGTGTTKASISLGQFPVTMRAIPNLSFTGVSLFSPASGTLSGWTVSASRCATTSGAVWANMTSGVSGQACVLYIPSSGYITYDAQL